jgi:DNA-binding CsgD family transcriptional regulator
MMLRGVARTNTADTRHGAAALSRAELIVLELIGGGATSNEIAAKLNRSVKTVDAHRANIKRKLGLANNNALLRYAMQFVQQNPVV